MAPTTTTFLSFALLGTATMSGGGGGALAFSHGASAFSTALPRTPGGSTARAAAPRLAARLQLLRGDGGEGAAAAAAGGVWENGVLGGGVGGGSSSRLVAGSRRRGGVRCQAGPRGSVAESKVDSGEDDEEDEDESFNPSDAALVLVPALAAAAGYTALSNAGVDPIALIQQFDFKALIESASDRVEELGPLGYAYFSAIYIVAEVLALPAVPLTASAGYLFGALPGTATVLFSATIAAGISFLLGRTFLRKYIEGLIEGNPTFSAIDTAVGREGFKIVLLLRLSPLLPFALSNYFYGLTAVDFWPYLTATLIGFSPGTFAYVYTGQAAKALSGEGGAEAALPWYAYAGAGLALAVISKLITDIASEALKDIELEAAAEDSKDTF